MNRSNGRRSPKPIVVLAGVSLTGIVACAAVIDLAEVAFEPRADGSLDAQAPPVDGAPVEGPDGSSDAASDADSDAQRMNIYLDDSAFCRGFPNARFCRQFDDDAAAGAGFVLTVTSGSFALETIGPFSPPRSLVSRTTSNGVATGLFAGAPVAHPRLELRVKVAASVDVPIGALARGKCLYVLGPEEVSTLVQRDGGGATIVELYPVGAGFTRDAWHKVIFEAEPSDEPDETRLRLNVDGVDALDVIDVANCSVDLATGFYLGLRGAAAAAVPQVVQFDDVVFSAVP